MKNKLKLVGFIARFYLGANQKSDLPVPAIDNKEALAYGEHGDNIRC